MDLSELSIFSLASYIHRKLVFLSNLLSKTKITLDAWCLVRLSILQILKCGHNLQTCYYLFSCISNIALVMVIGFINCNCNQWEWQCFLSWQRQTPSLGPAVSCDPQSHGIIYASLKILLSAAEWELFSISEGTKYRAVQICSKQSELFHLLWMITFCVSWWQDQTIGSCHLCVVCSLSENFVYRL